MEGRSLEQLIIDLKESLEREIGELRREVRGEIGELRREVRDLRERLDRLEGRVTAMSFDIAGINHSLALVHRALDEAGHRETETIGVRVAQQKAIDDLAARVRSLEQRMEGKQ